MSTTQFNPLTSGKKVRFACATKSSPSHAILLDFYDKVGEGDWFGVTSPDGKLRLYQKTTSSPSLDMRRLSHGRAIETFRISNLVEILEWVLARLRTNTPVYERFAFDLPDISSYSKNELCTIIANGLVFLEKSFSI